MATAAEAFFARLPVRLSEDEQELVVQLERVGKVAQRFLPPCVTLQAWAERRLLETDGTRANASGLVYVAIGKRAPGGQDRPSDRGDRDQRGGDRDHHHRGGGDREQLVLAERGHVGGERASTQDRDRGDHRGGTREEKGHDRDRGDRDRERKTDRDRDGHHERDRRHSERPSERPSDRRSNGDLPSSRSGRDHYELSQKAFYEALPRDGLTKDEQDLRAAMAKVLSSWRGSSPPLLAEVAQDARVDACMRRLLPKDVSLRNWCATRVSSEIELAETRHNGDYTYTVGLVHSRRPEPPKTAAPPPRSRDPPPTTARAGSERQESATRPTPTPRPPQRSPSPPGARSRSNSVVWSPQSPGAVARPPSRSRSPPRRTQGRSPSQSGMERLNVTMPHNEVYEGEQVDAVVLERPAQSGSGEPIWQAEIEMAQGGTNHSGRARTFNIRGPPRKSKEAAEEDAAALTRVSSQGPKVVRGVANNMHRG